ncbi:DNA polymerase III subunit delta' [Henriciella aquimarina]|uniref:DNA polymerase III subunit delta' n=1 Tax=Henriciella aquimarina TaxID=545261 RepID=UPI000A00319B|nr:DNA polymerase III subunit delta' [Henriciella aquimarina]
MSEPAFPLFGHEEAQAEFLSARESGRLHHAWIIEGPSGIGKTRFATRLASLLLGARPVDGDPAGAPESDPVMQKILSSGHPDFKHVQREANDKGVLKQDISVDQIRDLNGFFSLKPALGGWRVGLIDSLDEMNVSGLNAVLKTLEEPPDRAILFLISHATAPILPTIRSRCQTLRLRTLSEDDTRKALAASELEAGDALVQLVKGRPGRAEELSGPKVMAAASSAQSLLKALPSANDAQISQAITQASEDDDSFGAFAEELLDWVSLKASHDPDWAEVWFQSQEIIASQRSFHMPPVQAAAKLVACLQTAFATR